MVCVVLVEAAETAASVESIAVFVELVAIVVIVAVFAESRARKPVVTLDYPAKTMTCSAVCSRSNVSPTLVILPVACSYSAATELAPLSKSLESECSDSRVCSAELRSWAVLWSLLWSRVSVILVVSLELK